MAAGEKKFTTQGQEVKKFTRTLLPKGDYNARLIATKASVGKKPEPGKQPYVSSVVFEILDSASSEGGKNRVLYHTFFTSLKPGKNGFIMVNKGDQIVGFAKAIGEEFTGDVVSIADEDGSTFDCIDPQQLKRWLEDRDGALVRLRVKHEKYNNEDKERIDYFIETPKTTEVAEYNMDSDTADLAAETEAALNELPVEETPAAPAKKLTAKPAQKR